MDLRALFSPFRPAWAAVIAVIGAMITVAGFVVMGRGVASLGIPVYAWQAIGALVFVAMVGVMFYHQHQALPHSIKAESRNAESVDSSRWRDALESLEVRQILIQSLRSIATDHSNARIMAFPASAVPVVELLGSIFDAAGWETNVVTTPQEPFHHRYIEGIQIGGHNKHTVDAVTQFLVKAGLRGITSTVESLAIKRDNPKYQRALHRVNLTIGHEV